MTRTSSLTSTALLFAVVALGACAGSGGDIAGPAETGGSYDAVGNSGGTGPVGSGGDGASSGGSGGTSAGGGGTSTGGTGVEEGPPAAPEGTVPNEAQPPSRINLNSSQWQLGLISPTLEFAHHNQPSIINGYLFLSGNSVFSIYDIADPTAPVLLSSEESPNNQNGREAEGHQVSFAKYGAKLYGATIQGNGIDLWDVTDARSPSHVKRVDVEGVNFGDFTEAVWGVAWQGTTIYVGGTNTGIHVVDAADPANARVVKRVSNLGGVSAGPLFAVGNVLVATSPKNSRGVATLDISNPHEPVLLHSIVPTANDSYIGGFYGHHAYLLNPVRVYDVLTDPTQIRLLGGKVQGGYFAYVSFQDGNAFFGRIRPNPGATKVDVRNPMDMKFVRDIHGRRDLQENDDQFTVAVGNLLILSDDQLSPATNKYAGTVIAVHDTAPDTAPPSVDAVVPKDGATGQAVTSRIGISFTDNVELMTVDTRSFIVRPVGGQALRGTFSVTMSVLNFDPEVPLESDTTYEVILPAGGVKDYVGNGIATEFRSTFTTR